MNGIVFGIAKLQDHGTNQLHQSINNAKLNFEIG